MSVLVCPEADKVCSSVCVLLCCFSHLTFVASAYPLFILNNWVSGGKEDQYKMATGSLRLT